MSANESPKKPGSYTVGLSTARFLDQAMLEDAAQAGSNQSASKPGTPVTPPVSPSSPRVESDQEVNSYMQQLLKRSNNLTPEPTADTPTCASQPGNESTEPADQIGNETTPTINPTPELGEAWTTEHYMPKKQAPERAADLKAFRQLANASARGALNSFQQKVEWKKSLVSGIVAVSSLLASVPLFLMSSNWGDNWSLCSLGSLVLAASSASQYFKSGRILKKRR